MPTEDALRERTAELFEREQDLAIILRSIGDAVIATDTQGRITQMNPAAEHLTGWLLAEASGKPLEDVFRIVNAQTREPVRNSIAKLLESGEAIGLASHRTLIAHDGTARQIADSATPIRNAVGRIRGAALVFHDVTAENRIKEALKKSEALLNETAQIARVGGWEVDADTLEQTWTEETYRIHEVDPTYQPTVSKGIAFYAPSSQPLIERAIQRSIELGEPFDLELEFITAKGNRRWIRAMGKTYQVNGKTRKVAGTFQDITERKNVEALLASKTILLETQLETSIDGILVVDNEGRTILVNKRFGELWRIPQHILDTKDDKTMLAFVLSQLKDPAEFGRKVAYLYEHQDEQSREEIVFADGRTFDRYSSPLIGADGKSIGRIWSFRDITGRKQKEELISSLNEQQKIILDVSPAMIFYKDKENRFIRVNKALAKANGLSTDEMEGKTMWDLYPKEAADHYWQDDKQVMAAGKPVLNIVEEMKTPDGARWVQTDKIPYRNPKGEIIGIVGFTTDITGRKQAETYREMGREILKILNEPGDIHDSIQRVLAALKTWTGFDAVGIRLQNGDDFPYFAQEGFPDDFLLTENTLIERNQDGGVCRDKDGNVCLECTCGLVISGKTDASNPLFTPGGSCWTNDSFPLLELPSNQDPRLNPRNQCIHHGYASVALVPIRNKDRIIGLIHLNDRSKGRFTLDTIESLESIASHIGGALMRKQAEKEKAELEEQNRQLQKAESLGRMAGAIAHQFNNQLQAVMGNMELAMRDLPRTSDSVAMLTAAMQAARKAAEVSHMMLTYLGQTYDKREPIDLSDACRRILPVLQAVIPKNVVMETDLPSPGPILGANADQIQQLLNNLVTNAWEVMGENKGVIRLSVKTVSSADIVADYRWPVNWKPQDQAYACLEVADTGSGIAPKDIGKLFDPFYSTKFIGRGLGLPVALGIVRSYEGCITLESEPTRGSVFRVLLPVSTAKIHPLTDSSVVLGSAHAGKTDPAPEFDASGTVLLVEDEQSVRKMAATSLAQMGFAVLEAKNGVEAIEVFRQHKDEVRCVICDLSMPRMNGWETIAALKALRADLPAILTSGYDESSVMAGDHPDKPPLFLGKPYTIKELVGALALALR